MKGSDCFSSYFLIAVLVVFFMLLYVYVGPPKPVAMGSRQLYANYPNSFEKFKDNDLLSMDKMVVIQGNGVPDQQSAPIQFDQGDPAAQSVDGTGKAPKSLFPFAYNKCDVNCCGNSPFTCSGGCVCLTKEQKRFLSSRGWNNKYNACSFDEY